MTKVEQQGEKRNVITAELSHNPYLLNTSVKFNGQDPKINSRIEKYEKSPLKDWVRLVPEIFYNEMNGYDFTLYFTGTKPDFEEVKKAFLAKGINEEEVRLSHKNEIEDADTKSREVDHLVMWLKNNRNRKFDFDRFWKDESHLFEDSYPFIIIKGALPSNSDSLFAFESVESAEKLKGTSLTNTPIVFYIDERTAPEFRNDLDKIRERNDTRDEQLFFMISPVLDRAQITRVIFDLGVREPQVIEKYDDDTVMTYMRNYPVTEFIRSAIKAFRNEVEEISAVLEAENRESVITNAEIYNEIDGLEKVLTALKDADDFFVQRDNYETPFAFGDIQKSLLEHISNWKSRKAKITGEIEIGMYANEFISLILAETDSFTSSMSKAYTEAGNSIRKAFSAVYERAGVDQGYYPTEVSFMGIQPITNPEISSELLKLTVYEESKNDFLGFFKKPNDADEPEMIATCYLAQWRTAAQNILVPVLENYISQCVYNLSEYYRLMAEAYHQHLTHLIEEKTSEKETAAELLSDDEKKLQEDNDWLSVFKEQLQTIERA